MRRIGVGLAAGLMSALIASSALAEVTPSPRQLELAQRYIAAMKVEKSMEATLDLMAPVLEAQGTTTKLTSQQREALTALVREVSRKAMTKMVDRMAPVMAELFTEKELEDLVAFYEGPAGQAIIAKGPKLAAEMVPVMQELIPQMRDDVLSRICEVVDCSEATKPDERRSEAPTSSSGG